jgi:hypothetical protein
MDKDGRTKKTPYIKIPEELARSWLLEYQSYSELSGYTRMLMKEISKELGEVL